MRLEGLDLSPQMRAVARAREAERALGGSTGVGSYATVWHHAAAEASGLPGGSHDLITLRFVCHELPAPIATLLKSSKPYLEDYFSLDFPAELAAAGFDSVQRVPCHPRDRVLVAIRAIKPSR